MATRIYKTEKFIPRIGNPVFQVHEEAEVGAQVIPLDPRNPSPEELEDANEAFAASQQAVIATLESEKANLLSAKEELQADKSSLEKQISAQSEQVEALAAERTTLAEQLTTANTRIAALLQEIPFNPRVLKGEAFYNRVSKEDMVTLLTSENPQLVQVGRTIDAYRINKWPVVLDSDDFQELVGYVLQSGVFDEKEVLAIMTDATREEAYAAE